MTKSLIQFSIGRFSPIDIVTLVTCYTYILEKFSEHQVNISDNFAERIQ